jgi:hypothetical protein
MDKIEAMVREANTNSDCKIDIRELVAVICRGLEGASTRLDEVCVAYRTKLLVGLCSSISEDNSFAMHLICIGL